MRALELLWTALSLPLLLAVAGLTGLTLTGLDSGMDEAAEYGRRFVALGPHKPAWFMAGDALWGLTSDSEMGSGSLPPTLAGYAPALLQCGLAPDAVIAAEVRLSNQDGPPWAVEWRPESALGDARGCVGAILAALPVDQDIPMDREGVFILRVTAADL